jgi:hypothetical protein
LNEGIEELGTGLLLNQWYHIAYALSDSEKRLDFYINGEWVGFHSIQPTEQIIFNTGPLYIGNDLFTGITGQIRYKMVTFIIGRIIKVYIKYSLFYK